MCTFARPIDRASLSSTMGKSKKPKPSAKPRAAKATKRKVGPVNDWRVGSKLALALVANTCHSLGRPSHRTRNRATKGGRYIANELRTKTAQLLTKVGDAEKVAKKLAAPKMIKDGVAKK